MYKLLVSDLDGTLVDHDSIISPRVKDAVQRAMDKGVRVTLATGRIFQVTLPFAEELNPNAPLICCNGGLIIDFRTREVVYQETIPLPLVREAVRFAEEKGLRLGIYFDDHRTSLEKPDPEGGFYLYLSGVQMHIVDDPLAFLNREPLKFLIITDDEKESELIIPQLQERLGNRMRVFRSTPVLVEAALPGQSKARGLARLAAHLGIKREETMAIGDNDNDAEMLAWAGLSVAMGNATPKTKAAADYIAPSISEDGAAEAIERFILR